MINPKYASQIQRNLDGFKEAVRKLCDRNSLNDGQRDKYYIFQPFDDNENTFQIKQRLGYERRPR